MTLSQKRGEIPLQHRKDISVTGTVSQPPETVSTVPSQAGLFGSIGLQLGLGRNKIPVCVINLEAKACRRRYFPIQTLSETEIGLPAILCTESYGSLKSTVS